MNMGNLGQEDTTRMVYSLGESETLVGDALKGVRHEIVLATKFRLSMSENSM